MYETSPHVPPMQYAYVGDGDDVCVAVTDEVNDGVSDGVGDDVGV